MHLHRLLGSGALATALLISGGDGRVIVHGAQASRTIPRTSDGRPNIDGIWKIRNPMPAGLSVVGGGEIPYQPWAAQKSAENFRNRLTADPLAKCFMAGVPRMMYLNRPFQILQTRDHLAMLFEWTSVYRL